MCKDCGIDIGNRNKSGYCRKCSQKIRGKAHYEKNKEKYLDRATEQRQNGYTKNYREENKEELSQYGKNYREEHKEELSQYGKNLKRLKRYGITLEEYNKIFESQKGCCMICGKHQLEFKRTFAVDHCHITGKVCGLLCSYCNTGLGLFKEDAELLASAIEYLNMTKKISKAVR